MKIEKEKRQLLMESEKEKRQLLMESEEKKDSYSWRVRKNQRIIHETKKQ